MNNASSINEQQAVRASSNEVQTPAVAHENISGLGILVLGSGRNVFILPSPKSSTNLSLIQVQPQDIRYVPYSGLINAKIAPRELLISDETVIFNRIKVETDLEDDSKEKKEQKKRKNQKKKENAVQQLLKRLHNSFLAPFQNLLLAKPLCEKKAKLKKERPTKFI